MYKKHNDSTNMCETLHGNQIVCTGDGAEI